MSDLLPHFSLSLSCCFGFTSLFSTTTTKYLLSFPSPWDIPHYSSHEYSIVQSTSPRSIIQHVWVRDPSRPWRPQQRPGGQDGFILKEQCRTAHGRSDRRRPSPRIPRLRARNGPQPIDLASGLHVLRSCRHPVRSVYDHVLPSGRGWSRQHHLGLDRRVVDYPLRGGVSGRDYECLPDRGWCVLPDVYALAAALAEGRQLDLWMDVCCGKRDHHPCCQLWNGPVPGGVHRCV